MTDYLKFARDHALTAGQLPETDYLETQRYMLYSLNNLLCHLEAQRSTQTPPPEQSTTPETCQHEPMPLTVCGVMKAGPLVPLPTYQWIAQCGKCQQAISTQWVTTRF